MGFSQVKNVRIKSLTPGAVVQLRFGKAAVKSPDDTIITAKLLRQFEEGEKSLVTFLEHDVEGNLSETTITRFPGAPWRSGTQYVSLVAVDEATFTIQKAAAPIQTDAIDQAIVLIAKEKDDVYAAELLIELLSKIKGGKRVNTDVKEIANRFANKLVDELSSLPDR